MDMEEDEVQKPRGTGEVLWWLVFEPVLLKEYSDTIKGWQNRLRAMMVPLMGIAVLASSTYVLALMLIFGLDLPYSFDDYKRIMLSWPADFTGNLILLFQESIWRFLFSLAFALGISFVIGLVNNLAHGLASGVVFCLSASLLFSLGINLFLGLLYGWAGNLKGDLAFSLGSGIMFGVIAGCSFGSVGRSMLGITGGLSFGVEFGLGGAILLGLMNGLFLGFVYGLSIGFSCGLTTSLAFLLIWLIFYFRAYFYIPYLMSGLFKQYSIESNPYCYDGMIFFSLPRTQFTLQNAAYKSPKESFLFSQFLFKQRPLQKKLAWQIRLAAIAGQWRKQRGKSDAFKSFPILDRETLWHNDKESFINLSRLLIPLPTTEWQPQIEATRLALLDVEQESNIRRKVAYCKTYRAELNKLYDLALQQSRIWGEYFVKALELWPKNKKPAWSSPLMNTKYCIKFYRLAQKKPPNCSVPSEPGHRARIRSCSCLRVPTSSPNCAVPIGASTLYKPNACWWITSTARIPSN